MNHKEYEEVLKKIDILEHRDPLYDAAYCDLQDLYRTASQYERENLGSPVR